MKTITIILLLISSFCFSQTVKRNGDITVNEPEWSKIYNPRTPIACLDTTDGGNSALMVQFGGGAITTYQRAVNKFGDQYYKKIAPDYDGEDNTADYIFKTRILQMISIDSLSGDMAQSMIYSDDGVTFTEARPSMPLYYNWILTTIFDDTNHVVYGLASKHVESFYPSDSITNMNTVVLRSFDFGENWEMSFDGQRAIGTIVISDNRLIGAGTTITFGAGDVITEGVEWLSRRTSANMKNIDCAKNIADAINDFAGDKYKAQVLDSGKFQNSAITIKVYNWSTPGTAGNGITIVSSDADITTTNFSGASDYYATQIMDSARIDFWNLYTPGTGLNNKMIHLGSGASYCYVRGQLFLGALYRRLDGSDIFTPTSNNSNSFCLVAKHLSGTFAKPYRMTWDVDTLPNTQTYSTHNWCEPALAAIDDTIMVVLRMQASTDYSIWNCPKGMYTTSTDGGTTWKTGYYYESTIVNEGAIVAVPLWSSRGWYYTSRDDVFKRVFMRIFSDRGCGSRINISTFDKLRWIWSGIYRLPWLIDEWNTYYGREFQYAMLNSQLNTIESAIFSERYKSIYVFTVDMNGEEHRGVYMIKIRN